MRKILFITVILAIWLSGCSPSTQEVFAYTPELIPEPTIEITPSPTPTAPPTPTAKPTPEPTKYSSDHIYITDYDGLKKILTEKYGKPKEDRIFKNSSLADYTDAGTALKLGYTTYRARWETDTTNIMSVISYESTEIIPATDTSEF